MGKRNLGFLVVAMFVGVLAGQIVGEVLKLLFVNLGLHDNVVQKVLVDSLVDYEYYPMRFNLVVLTLTFGFSLEFNLLSLLGIGAAWYYVKYSY